MTADIETIALGYEELAVRARISVQSARRIARRHRWRKVRGNNGHALVHVPVEYLQRRDADIRADSDDPVRPDVPSDVRADIPPDVPIPVPLAVREAEILARLDRMQAELVEMARRLGASDALVAELRADRDTWKAQADAWRAQAETAQQRQDELRADRDTRRAQAERLVAVEGELQAVKEDRERLATDLGTMRERMAKAEHDRDRLTQELDAHLRLPWWRRLFA
jgi:hypothetical protein